ncbi:pyrroloquinoline quinone-dependent dehydrogenase [Devosia sp.]|uniref:pyrroloquinoline quinone-dependent dehydrogenase n=1 Tax=Devosia sp. TaxID=1871048 RepID=UPI003A8DF91D
MSRLTHTLALSVAVCALVPALSLSASAQDTTPSDTPAAPEVSSPSATQPAAPDAAIVTEPAPVGTSDDAATTDTAARQIASPDAPLVPEGAVWNTFHGQLNAQKYSPLTQITTDNVGKLEKVWEYHTGDMSDGSGGLPETVWSATPVFANDTIYVGTPFYRVIALDPATGKEKWSFASDSALAALTQPALKNRGVAYWEAKNPVAGEACQKIVYLGTMDAQLFALDADTGEKCVDFGDNGVLDVDQWNTLNDRYPLSLLQPPTVVGDHVIFGWAGKDWAYAEAPQGNVFSVDPQTGEKQWQFDTIPAAIAKDTGTANVWTGMSADEALGLVYLPVSSPSPNYWGGNRTESIPYATSTTALDLETGKVVWSRQWVHHDIWDYDTNSAPTLMDIDVDGKTVHALMQATKMGFLFVVDRATGEDVWPIEERPVPQGDGSIKGEAYSPTQPFPTKPAPLLDQAQKPKIWGIADAVGFGECSALFDDLTYEGMYTPPGTSGKGTLAYPDSAGGVQWGGVAFDPVTQTAVVNVSHITQYIQLFDRAEYDKQSGGSGNENGLYPQEGAPYGMALNNALNWAGMPCWEPPFGELLALDMHTGDVKWRRPMGASQEYGFYMPESMGSPTIGGPAITAGGVIFIGASMDAKVRAFDLTDGKELWSDLVQAPAVAIPSVYEYDGRQYVVFVAGGNSILKHQVGDEVVAYALPQSNG